ncbi:Predicted dehydrogenase [Anaerocolumna jejuensis DSM 15929]|uniref:Predicted dehydrogenase n=1 Tax=Anaerocolumna jejuensis DSM 15929 TaxID=1121322 RepID=A0A1M6R2D3_9FIRM|nr:Gfo/Idh/MocA family oxidoreductase [Anaerocolumna jejuensis]SHK26661.1 Predicted dehydrogenase [Anaerocolumna jejuensis DSM 15929]
MKYTMAIIGFGGMGSWHAENVLSHIDGITVKGVYDIQKSAQDKALSHGLYVYGSLEELLEDREIDLVTIATPNDSHKDYAIALLKAGKNVICEKPVTMNVSQLEEIMETAEKSGKIFSIHQNRRWDKDFVIIKTLLDQGELGRPYFIESRVQGSRRAMYGWRGHKTNGGGMVLDWGVHLLDQLLNLIDSPVVSVDAHLFSLYSDEVDDNIKIFLRFENKVSALCEMSTNCLINHPRWHISCTDGTAVIEDWSCKGKIVKLKADSQMSWSEDIVYTEAGPTRTMAPRPEYTTNILELPEVQTDWSDYYKNIVNVMEGKAELIVKPQQALRVMKVIEKVFESEETGAGVSCHI